MTMIDPFLQLLIAASLSILFFGASQHKRSDTARFRGQLGAYGLVPDAALPAVARVLPWLELATALALLIPATRAGAGIIAATLLTLYGVAMAINLGRGQRSIDCGCGGPAQPLSWWLVLRNAALASCATLLIAPTADRLLGALDAFALLLLCAVLSLTYLALGQLLHNRAVLGGWKQ